MLAPARPAPDNATRDASPCYNVYATGSGVLLCNINTRHASMAEAAAYTLATTLLPFDRVLTVGVIG